MIDEIIESTPRRFVIRAKQHLQWMNCSEKTKNLRFGRFIVSIVNILVPHFLGAGLARRAGMDTVLPSIPSANGSVLDLPDSI